MCDDALCAEATRTGGLCLVESKPAEAVPVGPAGRLYLQLQHDEVQVLLVEREDGKFALWWNDHVANESEEEFDDLGVAVARVAALVCCARSDWAKVFVDEPDVFAAKASVFLDAATNQHTRGVSEKVTADVTNFLDAPVN